MTIQKGVPITRDTLFYHFFSFLSMNLLRKCETGGARRIVHAIGPARLTTRLNASSIP